MFLGAPLVASDFETGTFRFSMLLAFTGAAGFAAVWLAGRRR